ncbi:MAG: hypothetical protein A4E59_00578 [Syntrophorhabdus sp. PtaB.Bin027]|nr:MAG: hypothetical protein A4E59_00578 [Syntrophorhabdus sp. PtaB.Bin027]
MRTGYFLGRAIFGTRSGLSRITVLMPTMIPSTVALTLFTKRRDSSFDIHLESQVFVAIFPSRLTAPFMVKNGLFFSMYTAKASFNLFASSSRSPTFTSMPAFFSSLTPSPFTSGFGSSMATTTLLTPAAMIEFTQGGVLPAWAQGSRLTYRVAPLASSFASFKATISA